MLIYIIINGLKLKGKKIIKRSLLQKTKNIITKILISLLIFSLQPGCNNNQKVYPERKDIIEAVYASGKIISENEHSIYALYNGTVIKKLVNDGDTVVKGQLLYVIRKEISFPGLQSGPYNSINKNLTKNPSFITVPRTTEKLFIRSDCDGLIYQATKETGESVRELELLVLIGERFKRVAELSVDQLDIARVKVKQMVLLKSDVTGDTIYEAEVKKIYPLMNETNQTFRVDVALKHNLNFPFIHNTVDGNILIQKKEKALVLPASAVLEGDSVYIENNNHVQKIKIKPGIRGIDFIEVLNGIDENTPVIIKNNR